VSDEKEEIQSIPPYLIGNLSPFDRGISVQLVEPRKGYFQREEKI
jgi:hypothetical protein